MPSGAADGSILIETKIDIEKAEKDFKKSVNNITRVGKQIDKAFGSTEKSVEKVENALEDAADQVEDFGDAAKDTARQVEDLGDAAKDAGNAAQKGFDDLGDTAKNAAKGIETTADAVKNVSDNARMIDSEPVAQMVRQLDNVNARIEVQQKELDILRERYESVSTAQGADSPQALKLQKQILNAESAMDRLINTSDRMAASIREMDAGMGEAAQGVGEFKGETEGAEQSTINFRDVVKEMFSSLGINADNAVDTVSDAFGEYKKSLSDTEDTTDEKAQLMGSLIEGGISAGVTAAIAFIAKIAVAVSEQADEVEYQADRMQVALNLSEEDAKAASQTAQDVYAKGLLSMQESEQAVVSVMKRLELSATDAEAVTNAASAVAVGHGQDIQEVIRTAAIMMDTYGLSATQAVDLIAYAFDTSAGEFDDLLDAMGEYAPRAQEIGFSATDMVSAISNAADAGAVSADKSLDLLKEVYNKAAGATDEYKEALEDLGLSSDQTISRLTGGGQLAREEMERVVQKIANVSSESEQARLASILLGSQWEDTSIGIALAVTNAQGSVVDFTGAAEKDFQTLTSNSETAVEQIKREWETGFTGLKKTLMWAFFTPVMQLIDSVKKGAAEIQKLLGGTKTSGYATGTSSATPGLHPVAERGAELVDTGDALILASSPTVLPFSGGETVYSAAQTSRIVQLLQESVAVENARRSHSALAPLNARTAHPLTPQQTPTSVTNYNFAQGSVAIDPKTIKDLDGFAQLLQRERNRRQDTQMGVSKRRLY